MPTAPLRPCAGGCGVLVQSGRCPACSRHSEQRRGTAHRRGYTWRYWQPFRRQFFAMLVNAGILPVCGAALPTGPANRDSACRDAGLDTFTSADGSSLHLDHEPALEDWERSDPARVCDPHRIVLKCQSCHQAKTAKELHHV
jgi:hypothetical protein